MEIYDVQEARNTFFFSQYSRDRQIDLDLDNYQNEQDFIPISDDVLEEMKRKEREVNNQVIILSPDCPF